MEKSSEGRSMEPMNVRERAMRHDTRGREVSRGAEDEVRPGAL